MRFLHTSDWHLGRIFHGVHLIDDQAFVLEQFVKLVSDTRPDAVVVAGDIYDRSVPPTEAVKLLDETLSRILLDYQTPVIIIAGNHDSPERLGFGNRLLERQGLYVVAALAGELGPVVLHDAYGPVYFAPLTYAEPALVRDRWLEVEAVDHDQAMRVMVEHVLHKIPADGRKVAIAHAFIAGGLESESERPLSVGGSGMVNAANFQSFNYTALGHLHNSQQAGGKNICYSGSLLKYSFAESDQQKGINLVELDGQGKATVEVVKLTPCRDVRCLRGNFKDLILGPQLGENRDDYIMVTLEDDQPVIDARIRLKEVYPNVLDFDYSRLKRSGELRGPETDHRKLTEKELFASFFEQMTGQVLTGEQAAEFAKTVDELYREDREVRM